MSFPCSNSILVSQRQFVVVITLDCGLQWPALKSFNLSLSEEHSPVSLSSHPNRLLLLLILYSPRSAWLRPALAPCSPEHKLQSLPDHELNTFFDLFFLILGGPPAPCSSPKPPTCPLEAGRVLVPAAGAPPASCSSALLGPPSSVTPGSHHSGKTPSFFSFFFSLEWALIKLLYLISGLGNNNLA